MGISEKTINTKQIINEHKERGEEIENLLKYISSLETLNNSKEKTINQLREEIRLNNNSPELEKDWSDLLLKNEKLVEDNSILESRISYERNLNREVCETNRELITEIDRLNIEPKNETLNVKLSKERDDLLIENNELKRVKDNLTTIQAQHSKLYEEQEVKLQSKEEVIKILEEEAANKTIEIRLLDEMIEKLILLRTMNKGVCNG